MKLEVGMYVRNDYFGIGKIDKDYFDSNNKHWFNVQFNCYGDDDCHCGICEQTIGYKASHNIIDLIEEKDILLLFDKEYGENYKAEVVLDTENFKAIINYEQCDLLNLEYELITEEHIKLLQILTKEQFESMSYRVGSEE